MAKYITEQQNHLRDKLAHNCMKWRLDDNGIWPEHGVNRCVLAIQFEHSGDCTNQPWTCLRCEAEMAYKQADEILEIIDDTQDNVIIVKSLMDTMTNLSAAISLLERSPKVAAPSNKMFDQMLVDYRNSLERARQIFIDKDDKENDKEI